MEADQGLGRGIGAVLLHRPPGFAVSVGSGRFGGGASLPQPGFAVSVGAVCCRYRRLHGWPRLVRPNGQTPRDRLRDCTDGRAGRG